MKRISTDWKTADIIAAELEFDDATTTAEADLAEAERAAAEVIEQDKPPTKEEIEQLRSFATGPHAPAEWQAVVAKVNRGELTWGQVASGQVAGDPEVMAALDAGSRELLDPEQVLGSGWARRAAEQQERAERRNRGKDWDDEDFSQNGFLS